MRQINQIIIIIGLITFIGCSKSATEQNIGQFPASIQGLPLGAAPVNISQELPGSDTIPARGIIARKSTWLRYNTQINSNVYVVGNCTRTGCLDPATAPANPNAINNADSELTVGVNVTIPAQYTIKADKIRLKQNAKVQGTAEANAYAQAKTATIANKVSPLGLIPNLPFFITGTPGTTDRTDANSPLASGSYRRLTARTNKTLVLTGGFYQLQEIDLLANSTLTCASQCTILVKTDVVAAKKVTVAAASTNPNDFLFYVEGGNVAAIPTDVNARAAQFSNLSNITANIYAPSGRLYFGQGTIAQGLFIANHVRIEPNSVVTQGPAIEAVAKLFEAGEPGSIEIAGKVKLEFPAGALAEDTIISVAVKPPIASTAPRSPAQLRFVGESFDFQPDGLTFAQNYTLTMNYNPAQVSAIGVTPNDIRVYSAPTDSAAFTASPTTLVAANTQLVASDNHFTFFTIGSTGVFAEILDVRLTADHLLVNRRNEFPGSYILESWTFADKTLTPVYSGASTFHWLPDILLQGGYVYTAGNNLFGVPALPKALHINNLAPSPCSGLSNSVSVPIAKALMPQAGQIKILSVDGGSRSGVITGVVPNDCTVNWNDNPGFLTADTIDEIVDGHRYRTINVLPFGLRINSAPAVMANQYFHKLRVKNGFALLGAHGDGQPTVRAYDSVTGIEYFHNTSLAHTFDLVVTGNVLYALQEGSPGRIVELDMTNPASPQPEIDSFPVDFGSTRMSAYGNYLVVATGAFSTPSIRLINIGFPVRGNVTGLASGTVELVNTVTTGTAPKTVISANGAYQNAELIADGNAYNFVVATQPAGHNCSVSNGSGTMDFHNAPTNVDVVCIPPTPPVVTSIDPADGTSGSFASIQVSFDQPMLVSTLTTHTSSICSGNVQLSADNFATCVPMLSSTALQGKVNTLYRVTPSLIETGKTYKVRILIGATSIYGLPMSAPAIQTLGFSSTVAFPGNNGFNSGIIFGTSTELLDGRILFFGGTSWFGTSGSGQNFAEFYDIAANGGLGSFGYLPPITSIRIQHSATRLADGRVLIAGGQNNNVFGAGQPAVELFNPLTNVTSTTGTLIVARYGHTAALLPSGKVLIAGGINGGSPLSSAEIYDPGTGLFTATFPMVFNRAYHTMTLLGNGTVLVTGGCSAGLGDTGCINIAEIFDPAANAGIGGFMLTGAMGAVRRRHSATLLNDGRVLITGGDSGAIIQDTAEIFDLTLNAGLGGFAATANMSKTRAMHTATLRNDGTVIIVGGQAQSPPNLIDFPFETEIFDPAGNAGLGAFNLNVLLAEPRANHQANKLADGRILIYGGQGFTLIPATEILP